MRSRATLAAIIAAIFVVGAATAPPVSAASTRDACSLLNSRPDKPELGVSVEAGEHVVASAPGLCGWAPPGGPTINGRKVVLSLKTTEAFNIGKTPIKGIIKTPVSGIGDDAYYTTASGLGTNLSVRNGDVAFNIALHGDFPVDQIKAKEKTLALQILSKL
jgi:hypothetical protein